MKTKIIGIIALIVLLIGANGCTQQDAELAANVLDEPEQVKEEVTDPRFTAYADSANLIGKEPVTLFFHADWCGTCVALEKEINAGIDELPKDARIIKVNFDKEVELKKEYGVLLQSMFVVLDKNGKVIEKLAAPTFNQLKEAIAASL